MYAVDYDGSIANANVQKAKWILGRLGRHIPAYYCDRTNCVPLIGLREYSRMSGLVYGASMSASAPVVPGVVRALNALSKRGDVFVITARNAESVSYVSIWLKRHNLKAYIKEIVPTHDRSKIDVALSLGCKVIIDDDIRHLLQITNIRIKRILLKIGTKAQIETPKIVTVCTTWKAALTEAIRNYDETKGSGNEDIAN